MKKSIASLIFIGFFLSLAPLQAHSGQDTSAETCYLSGKRFVQKKKIDRAIDYFKKAVALKPEVTKYHYSLGEACRIKGAYEEAASSFERVLKLDPDNGEALCRLGEIGRAHV